MNENKKFTASDWVDPDDAPDMSTPYWLEKFEKAKVQRGRPKLDEPKRSTTLRLDQDVIDYFKSGGPGWQTRINDALRKAAHLDS